jgi:hypothetical protein
MRRRDRAGRSRPGGGGPSLEKAAKVTICHAAGRADTDKYVSINVSGNAGYTPHLNDNGTAAAGHEQDYLAAEGVPCGLGTLQICVITNSASGTDHATPQFNVTATASGGGPNVISQQFLFSLQTQCSEAAAVPAGTYTANHPAPGLPETSPPNGDWFTVDVSVSPAANAISTVPAIGTTWGPATGRGQASSATVSVVLNTATVVTFNNIL